MDSPQIIALYSALLFAELNGRLPDNETEYSNWLACTPQIPEDFETYNEEVHAYITGLVDEYLSSLPRLCGYRAVGFLLGLHRSGKDWDESQVLALAYITAQKEPPAGLTTQRTA